MIYTLFTLHFLRFGYRFVTYLQTYTMFVACTINILDYKENLTNSNPDSHAEGDGFALAQEASARLDFGLEVLRQAKSTPSAGRCAAIIAQLLQKGDKPASGGAQEKQQETHSGAAEDRSNLAAMPNSTFTPTSPAPGTMYDIERRTHGSLHDLSPQTVALSDDHPPRYRPAGVPEASIVLSSNTQPQYLPYTATSSVRWLPENMQDDGSWMFMTDADLDLDITSITNF